MSQARIFARFQANQMGNFWIGSFGTDYVNLSKRFVFPRYEDFRLKYIFGP